MRATQDTPAISKLYTINKYACQGGEPNRPIGLNCGSSEERAECEVFLTSDIITKSKHADTFNASDSRHSCHLQ